MRPFISLIVFSVFFLGCNRGVSQKDLNALDSLYSVSIKADSLLGVINKIEINEITLKIEHTVGQFHAHYADTIPWETAKLISKYHRLKKAFVKHIENNDYITKELNYTKTQLQNLKKDLENNVLKPEKFRLYYNIEAETLLQLDSLAKHEFAFASNKLQMYKEWDPAINDLLNKLKLDSVSSTIE